MSAIELVRNRFNHHQAERLGPIDGKQQRCRIRQKLLLCPIFDVADKLDLLAIHHRLQTILKITLLAPRHLRYEKQQRCRIRQNSDL